VTKDDERRTPRHHVRDARMGATRTFPASLAEIILKKGR
jgi:hypothetical protein